MRKKWAPMRSPDMPAWSFARDVIHQRAEIVMSLLPLAAHHYQQDTEYVHQLRVSCRRTVAALRALGSLASAKPKGLKKWLQRIRQAAGPARDLDVLLQRFGAEEADDPVVAYALDRLPRERQEAQGALVKVAGKASRGKLTHSAQQCFQSFVAPEVGCASPSIATFAKTSLRLASEPFMQQAQLRDPTLTELHQLRIAGKRLRYSIEIFHAAFPSQLREALYPQISAVQERLGQINDHATAQALFQDWLAPLPANELAAHLAQRIAQEHELALQGREAFLQWWIAGRLASIKSALHELTD